EDGEEIKLLRGGKGGLGNWHFATATNRAPRYAQPGQPAIEKAVILELKLLGDVGLVGFPNAGKSTLLSSLSSAKPKIADYPFTTMEPSLGIVQYRGDKSFVMADIPGIIEGASEGKGLGLRFLRHIERNAVLLFMVPADSDDIKKDYEILLKEVKEFNPELADKSRVLAITKSDLLDDELREALMAELPEGIPTVFISAVTGQGLTELKDLLWREINSEENQNNYAITHRNLDVRHRVEEEDNFIFEQEDNDEDDFSNYTDEDWEDEFWDEETSVNPD
ncbi:MAG: 50S ribosome-binding GTPase, partial [Muribaculaceae bacterium]|nr:50S ribosome-binding GTPase [Muribaculaceae bacterium]